MLGKFLLSQRNVKFRMPEIRNQNENWQHLRKHMLRPWKLFEYLWHHLWEIDHKKA